jgi:RND family efflux transporter MFP subunit
MTAARAAVLFLVVAGLGAGGAWWWLARAKPAEPAEKKGGAPIAVTTAPVVQRDVPVRLRANGSVVTLQSVDVRSQITSTVKTVHIREGQFVKAGDLLFSLDARAEEASLKKAQAQVAKDEADLATAKRNLERQQELFRQKFVSQAGLDTVQNQVDTLTGQLAVDQASVESARVALAYTTIRAGIAGRTGAIGVRAGSLVQPTSVVMVNITQVDPITVAFALPQNELAGLQQALAATNLPVEVRPDDGGKTLTGKIIFVDNAVDGSTGTIKVKAEFPNPDARLWPGMLVNVVLSPRTLQNASVVPAQAVQTGPEQRFVYVVGADRKVSSKNVTLAYVDEGAAVVTGIEPGMKVVTEGAQNVRPGSTVAEAGRARAENEVPAAGEGKRKGKGS